MTYYEHGGDIYRNQIDYDFSVNTNPLGMPKASIFAAQEGVLLADRYPDSRGEELRTALAEKEGIKAEWILPGNGAAELIYAVCHALRPKTGMTPAPSFYEYEAAVRSSGGRMCYWDLKEEEGFELEEDILSVISGKPEILFLCNPNNPTGKKIDRDLLKRIAAECQKEGVYLCLDECFLPFLEDAGERSMTGYLKKFPNLLILKAFTKIYGMAGLRLGYLLSSNEELLKQIRSCIQPWNTSIPAQMAGIAALQDEEYLYRTKELLRKEKPYLLEELRDGLTERVYGGEANYLFFKSREDLRELLLEKKILIRSCENYRNLDKGYFRIAVRTHEENEELIRRWRESVWQNRL